MYIINFGKYANSVKVYIDDEFHKSKSVEAHPKGYSLYARRPYYRLRGKPVDREEAVRIIAKTDGIFWGYKRMDIPN